VASHGDGLTTRQRELLGFIHWYVNSDAYGMAPRLEDICEAMGLRSVSSANRLVTKLVEKGYVFRAHNMPRGIYLTEKGKSAEKPIRIDLMDFLKTAWEVKPDDCHGPSADAAKRLHEILRSSGIHRFSTGFSTG
jgi:SOS-response transcriptional repressor LexA